MVSPFEELGLLPPFLASIETLGFETPTPIQQAAIPALLWGSDVIGQAQTGTGKTAAFALPLLQSIQPGAGHVQALVLAPTRELAIQVASATSRLGAQMSARILAVYGGQSYTIQTRQLQRGVDVVVGTPGRLLDLVRQKVLDLSQVHFLVLDEADEMLEMGFIDDVETILGQLPAERQMALFSATMPEAVRRLAERYLHDPQQIRINPSRPTVAETEQRFCRVLEEAKEEALVRLLEVEDVRSALIFARTKARAQELADALMEHGFPAEALHGDLNQARREFVLNRFRQRSITLLVATDVAARGLDIEDVSHVFNYDVPADPEDYIHRIGRTGRAGRKGIAVTFITPRERFRLKQIEASTRQAMLEHPLPNREMLLARRDERFLQRLNEQMSENEHERERTLVQRLVEQGQDPLEIAAAAIQLLRVGESELLPDERLVPAAEPRRTRKSKPDFQPALYEDPRSNRRPRRHEPERSTPTPYGRSDDKAGRSDRPVVHTQPLPPFRRGHAQETGMVRLKMNLGNAHGLRPGDVVGAIASEAGIPGKAIGEIDIHGEITFVDVAEQHVRKVLQASMGKYYLRGKAVILTLAN